MGETTNIAWCHHTFNPWIGCTRVHEGCRNCYAEAQNERWAYNGGTWGPSAPRKVTSDANWRKPIGWARAAAKAGVRRRVFCASLADVLDEKAPPDAQRRLWDLIRATAYVGRDERGKFSPFTPTLPSQEWGIGGLDWLLLTKRPERWELIPEDVRRLVWFGTSVSDDKTAKEWIGRLLRARGFAKLFLSMEPLIGPVDMYFLEYAAIDWVIVGGESGPGARPFRLEWARHIVGWAKQLGIAAFVKQLGARPIGIEDRISHRNAPSEPGNPPGFYRFLNDRAGADMAEWPADLRIQEFPT